MSITPILTRPWRKHLRWRGDLILNLSSILDAALSMEETHNESRPHSSVWWAGSSNLRRRSRSAAQEGRGAGTCASLRAKSSGYLGAEGAPRSETAAHSWQRYRWGSGGSRRVHQRIQDWRTGLAGADALLWTVRQVRGRATEPMPRVYCARQCGGWWKLRADRSAGRQCDPDS